MKLEVTDKIKQSEQDEIYQGLLEYKLSLLENKSPQDLGIYMRNEESHIVAGLIGSTHGVWFTIKYLFVSENLRGQGIGSHILAYAEKVTKERGCKYIFVDTFDFQAPDFYKRYGYTNVFTLENYPVSGKRYYFIKNL